MEDGGRGLWRRIERIKTMKENDGTGRKGGGSSITEEEWRMTKTMKEDRR
jgi:hypothetical protein